MKYLDIHPLMNEFGIRPKKSLGQNFLVEPAGLRKVIEAAGVQKDDQVLEIGAGLGSLTVLLAQAARSVVAVEIDRELIPPLQKALEKYPNVQVVHGDILRQIPDTLGLEARYLVVANIPYYISSAILRHLLTAKQKPARMILTVQKEVAERVCAKEGKHSLLSLSVQVFGNPRLAGIIPAGSFLPAPEVDSAVLVIDLLPQPAIPEEDLDRFFSLAKAGFSQKRKTLRNSLSGGLRISTQEAETLLANAGLDPMLRAEALSLEAWGSLVKAFKILS
ncbi:MAG TPA: 16S rRNA (adenine(1518)-N(6)/adenine(1519)-N(6))-dimethyltransferase RsmA [Anaerolineaceae bacterium]|nr:16S rRNA (adenine(1518)-N(6)/adenine(1519)-N(6))-dimethyltransferase RsmA [Anaerolineaceae bacterium]